MRETDNNHTKKASIFHSLLEKEVEFGSLKEKFVRFNSANFFKIMFEPLTFSEHLLLHFMICLFVKQFTVNK